jgi:glycosyltransferase involved in cell wall biosynthesis
LATLLKWPSKTNRLIRWASAVACGSPNVASYVRSLGASATLIPTAVDTTIFRPAHKAVSRVPVVGWIGTHGTYAYLERLFPLLQRLRCEIEFRLLIAGAGRDVISVLGVETITRSWSLETEVTDFQALDVGLYPITDDEWSAGKSGLKAVQYMACGVPFVMSPVGICATMGIAGETHFAATTDDDWYRDLRALLTDENLRKRMGASGRAFAETHCGVEGSADLLSDLIRAVART